MSCHKYPPYDYLHVSITTYFKEGDINVSTSEKCIMYTYFLFLYEYILELQNCKYPKYLSLLL